MSYQKDQTQRPQGISGTAAQPKKLRPQRPVFNLEPRYTYKEWKQEFWRRNKKRFLQIGASVCLLMVLVLGSAIATFAQEKNRSTAEDADFELLVEELFALQDEDVDYTDLYESLFQYFTQPINLNNTSKEVLQSLYILSDPQIDNFFNYLNRNGKLLTIYELQAIEGWDLTTINRVLPFVTVREQSIQTDTRSIWQRIAQEKNNFLILRYAQTLENRRGYQIEEGDTTSSGAERSRYLGSPYQLYMRYRIAHTNDFSIGLTLEKDQGEQLRFDTKDKRYGADFISAHAVFYNQGKFKAIAVGDYQLQFGQGLLLSAGFGFGKGSETINTARRSTLGIRPYGSVVEGGFFRGAAATYQVTDRIDATVFYSNLAQDANINILGDTLSQEEEFINSIQATGLHRTQRELASRKEIREQTFGGNVSYKSKDKNLELGVTMVGNQYSVPLFRSPNKYNQFEFGGKTNYNIGINYNYNWRNFDFFGEGAVSKSGGMGFVGGFLTSLSQDVQLAMVFRHFDRNFHSFYGAPFSEGTRPINETGMYWGLKYQPNRRWLLTAYYDKFKFPWLRFRADAPTDGYEFLARLTHKPSRRITMYGQIRQEVREQNWNDETQNINYVLPYRRRQYQLRVDYRAEKVVFFRSRVQFSSFKHNAPATTGYLIAQDVNFDLGKVRLSTRFSIFDTDDFDNRQYVYEKDVLYVFSIPFFNGTGFRNYYVLQLRPMKKLDIWVKYAFTQYKNLESIGSGLDEIQGNRRSDLRVQLRYKFK